jgi:hypothetical protein
MLIAMGFGILAAALAVAERARGRSGLRASHRDEHANSSYGQQQWLGACNRTFD